MATRVSDIETPSKTLAAWRDRITVVMYGLAGGFGDATSYLRFKTFTGHVTGNLVLMMISLSEFSWHGVLDRLLSVVIFLLATRAGFRLAALKSRTAWLFVIQAMLMGVLFALERAGLHFPGLYTSLFCATLGLQNGVITKIHNVSLHSTFLSGDFTKLLNPRLSLKAGNPSVKPHPESYLLETLIGGFAVGVLFASRLIQTSRDAVIPIFVLILALAWVSTLGPLQTAGSQERSKKTQRHNALALRKGSLLSAHHQKPKWRPS